MSAALAEVAPHSATGYGRGNEALVAHFARTSAPEALDRLVRDNQRLVHYLLKRFSYTDEPYEDLVQVANVGLVKAVRRFDPGRGVRFSTYALVVMDGEVRHHLRDSLLLRQPRWVRRLYAQIQATKTDLSHKLGRDPEIREIAEAMNVSEDGILEVLALCTRLELLAWDRDDPEDAAKSIDRHRVRSLHQQSFTLPIEDRVALETALERLTDFQRRLIDLLFFREFTQAEVASSLGVTQRKVTRELQKSMARLRDILGKRIF